jgi:hypothetical protein
MITLLAGVRILLATKPVDFRRGAHSLAALAAAELGTDPFCRHCRRIPQHCGRCCSRRWTRSTCWHPDAAA